MKATPDVVTRIIRHAAAALRCGDTALFELYQWVQTLQALPALLVGDSRRKGG